MTLFHVIGLVTTVLAGLAAIAAVILYLFYKLLYKRFHWIPCRKTERSISLASWHNTRVMQMGNQDPDPAVFTFDDWPIRQRPFFVSYTFGKHRAFMMFGVMDGPRWTVGKGKHPDATVGAEQ